MKKIVFTPEKRKALRKAYLEAVAAGDEQFVFEGDDYLTSYAKYLLEYLTNQLK